MNKFLSLLIFLLLVINIDAQETIVKGNVSTFTGEPIEFATIILQSLDSTFINSVYTDSLGRFSIKSSVNKYRLIVQHLIYQTTNKIYEGGEIGTIILKEKDNILNEVNINGERPLIKASDGRLTYNMRYLLEKKVAETAYDAVLQLPGVSDQSGTPLLVGSNELSIIINGKPSTMSSDQLATLLKNMPSSRIEKAEVMYSAPPQYHVRGAIINLILKKERNNSLEGQINTSFTQKYYSNYSLGTTLIYSSPKISTDFLYTLSQTKQKTGLDLLSHHTYAGNLYDIEQTNRGFKENLIHNFRFGIDYQTGQDDLNIVYTSQITPKINNYERSIGNFSDSENKKKENNPIQMHNLNIVYTFRKKLVLGVDYTYYEDKTTQNYTEEFTGKANNFTAQSNQSINRIKFYIDHSLDLNKAWTIKYGAHMQYNVDHNLQKYDNELNMLNTDSKQKEYTYNIYLGVEKQITDKLLTSVSFAGEYYKFNNIKEWALFPSAEITYIHSPANIYQLSFSSNRQYPSYWEMSSTVSYLNGYTEIWGNPSLTPYRNYSGQLNYIHKNKYIISAYYVYNDNYFAQLPYQSSKELKLIYQTTNFNYEQKTGLNAVLPATWGILNSKLTLNGFYHKVKNNSFHDISFNKDNWVFYSKLDNTLNISDKPDIKTEFALAYISKNIQGPMSLSQLWNTEIGIKWTSTNKRSVLSLKGYDLFNSWVPDITSKFENQNLEINLFADSRFFTLTFIYKFGKEMRKQKRGSVDTSRFGKN